MNTSGIIISMKKHNPAPQFNLVFYFLFAALYILFPFYHQAQTKNDMTLTEEMHKNLFTSKLHFDSCYLLLHKMDSETNMEESHEYLMKALADMDSCIKYMPACDSLMKITICPEFTFKPAKGETEYKKSVTGEPDVDYLILMEEIKLLRDKIKKDYEEVANSIERNRNRWGNWAGPSSFRIKDTENTYMNFIQNEGFPAYFEFFDVLKLKIRKCLNE